MTREVGASAPDRRPDELERRLQEVDALRRRVVNVIPHALRTPITTLRGLTDALSTASEAAIRTEIAPALQRLAAQAERLLDDILLAAGMTTTLPTGEPEPVPVAPTVARVWDRVAQGRPPLRVEGEDVEVLAPAGSLERILTHVLDNAAKYGDDDPSVRIEAGGVARIVVDSPGDDAVELTMLGEPFFRGERAVLRAAGLGVGLAVARALVEQANGTLRVAARRGGGLVTTVELPRA